MHRWMVVLNSVFKSMDNCIQCRACMEERELKTVYKFTIMTAIVFSLCFAVSTLGYSVVFPSIGTIRVVCYGFPMTWLRATTVILPPSPTQYIVLWFELCVDAVFYLALSLAISFVAIKPSKRLAPPAKTSLGARVLLVILAAYSTKLISCGIHELLGHSFWAWIFGASSIQVYVSWLGFGWCRWNPSLSGLARVMAVAGGLVNTFIIGAAILVFLYLVPKKDGFYLRFPLFWLGFWTTITQASYLLLGGLTGYGDPGALYSLTGVPLSFFVLLGFGLFLLVYLVVSVLFLSEVSGLFPEYREKTLLFEFWLTMPIQVIFFMASPEHALSFELFFLLLVVSMIPSLLSLPFFQLFNRLRVNTMKKARAPQHP